MASADPAVLLEDAYKRCKPCSRAGRFLLDEYWSGVEFERDGVIPERELINFYEVCRLAETFAAKKLSVETLEAAIDASEKLSPTALNRRRLVVGRLIRLLELRGLLPPVDVRRNNRALVSLIERMEHSLAKPIGAWVGDRGTELNSHELLFETPKIAVLERVATEQACSERCEIINAWLSTIVSQVVDCKCPPVTRIPDPTRCNSCGATTEIGTRPSPGPRKQRELRAIAERYLTWRSTYGDAS